MNKALGVFLASGVLATSILSVGIPAYAADGVQAPIKTEYESLSGGTATECSGASGGQVLIVNSTEKPTISAPLSILKKGYYEITYVVGVKEASNSLIDFTINAIGDFELPCNNSDTPSVVAEYTGPSGWTMKKFTRKSVWIEANEYEIVANLSANSSGAYNACLDYIEVKPTTPPRILPSAPTRIELDEYAHMGIGETERIVTADGAASGGFYAFDTGTQRDPSKSIPVVIEKSGYYHVEAVAADRYYGGFKPWYSKMEYKLDDLLLLDNDRNAAEILEYTTCWDLVGLYRAEWVWLPAGEHDLNLVLYDKTDDDNRGTPPNWNYEYDYIEFVPATNGITMEDGVIKVHASYLDKATGRVIMAAYNERNELVGSVGYDVSEKPFVNFTLEVKQPVAKVKVFLWDSIENIAPLEIEKEFDLTS